MAQRKTPADPGKDNLIALHRAPLTRPRRPIQWLDELLSRLNARALVQAMPEQEVYLAVREIGLADAIDLLRLCTPEQIRACLDIDCWEKDQLVPQRLLPWIEALLELGHERVGRIVEALDHEMLVTFLRHHVRVYDLSMDEPPEEPEGQFYQTPDRFYVLDVIGEQGQVVERLIESIYMADLELGRRVVMGVRWDIGAETEELAYRFRSGRMADLGYTDYYEALKIYAYLDPHSVRLGEQTATAAPAGGSAEAGLMPTELSDALGGSTLERVLRLIEDAQRAHLLRELLVVLNQALSADRVDPADLEGARRVMHRAAGYLSLALEYFMRPRPDDQAATPEGRAVLALRSVHLSRLFRVGYSLTVQLSRLAAMLKERGLVTLLPKEDPASLLEPPFDEVVRLLEPPARPLYSAQLEGGPPGGRPFRSLADIARTASALEEIKAQGDFLTTGLGVRRDNLGQALAGRSPAVRNIRLTDLLGTLVANLLLRRPAALVPLSRADLPALRQAALGLGEGGPGLSLAARQAALDTLRVRVRERSLSDEEAQALWPPAVDRFVEQSLDRLGRSLAALPSDLGPAEADALATLPGVILA